MTPIYFRGRQVMCAENGIAYRRAKPGERLRKPEGWSFHERVIAQLERVGTQMLVVEDQETGITYTVDWPTFLAKAFALDRGAGPQRALPLGYWHMVLHGRATSAPVPTGPAWQQERLFK